MLQRIQTVFLFLIAVSMFLTIFFPFWSSPRTETEPFYAITALYFLTEIPGEEGRELIYWPYMLIGILAIASVTVAAIEISKFKNRLLQMKLGALNSVLMMATIGWAVYLITRDMKALEAVGSYHIGLYLPAAAMVLNIIANRFIRRDEMLVRDSERLR
jgi:hypothetical protein